MDRLRREIAEITYSHKISEDKMVSRIFYVPVNEEFNSIQSWFSQWFPVHDEILQQIYCWLPSDSDDDPKTLIESSWRKAMDANLLKKLTTKGYRLLDNSVQVIFLVDLSIPGSYEKLDKLIRIFNEYVGNWGSGINVVYTGIAILRNYQAEGNKVIFPENLEPFFDLSAASLNRLFCVDITNPQGTFISDASDMNFFIGQLLYFLTQKPIDANSLHRSSSYAEWVSKIDAQKGLATAFSAISLLLPIDYIMEVCLVRKGAELLENILFSNASK
ncbi:MAG: hypothetical protein IH591_09590, partial [Bacteroidales bacterium]|nr:hypothetical protein [Bacteroidales bacterium]